MGILALALITTTIGAYPKPDFVTVPDWFANPDTPDPTAGWVEAVEALGEHANEVFARGTESAITDQVDCGIHIPTDGEIRRENYIHYHCRHLSGFDFEGLTEREVRGGNYNARLPTIRGPIRSRKPFLDEDFRIAQGFTHKPVKITLPGPLTVSDTTVDAHYGDPKRLGADLADALNAEVLALANAGCRYIQVDEPVFARKAAMALDFGVEHLERVFHGCPAQVTRIVHICCGYPDRLDNETYGKAPQEAYHQLAGALEASSVQAVSIEDAHRHNDLRLLERFSSTSVIFGVIAVAQSRVETVAEISQRLNQALEHIDPHRLIAAPDCGLGMLGRKLALAKLKNLGLAAQAVG